VAFAIPASPCHYLKYCTKEYCALRPLCLPRSRCVPFDLFPTYVRVSSSGQISCVTAYSARSYKAHKALEGSFLSGSSTDHALHQFRHDAVELRSSQSCFLNKSIIGARGDILGNVPCFDSALPRNFAVMVLALQGQFLAGHTFRIFTVFWRTAAQ
jgi:hypothetical protein